MKIIKITVLAAAVVLGLCVLVFVIRTAGLFAVFSHSNSLHQKRIQQATEGMAAYRYEDWRALYADCTDLYKRLKPSNIAIETNEWPKQLLFLQPAYVWVNEDCISMNWTGGFDDFSLYLYIYRQNSTLNGSQCSPGVYVVDTRGKLPAHPYDKGTDVMSQSGRGDRIAPVTPPTPPGVRVRTGPFQSDH